jgi:hypothetical protein
MNSERSWIRLATVIIFQRGWFGFIKGLESPLALLDTIGPLMPLAQQGGCDRSVFCC